MQVGIRKLMHGRAVTLLMCLLVVSPALLNFASVEATATKGRTTVVSQFGSGFDETVIADASDKLDVPRDLEFNPDPANSNELWVLNRATDSMTIIHETSTGSQWSENKHDSYANHFMEEASAFSFGQYNSQFGTIFATAQETRNTFDGSQSPNNFMGPALWPSAADQFAEANQGSGGPLGSHLDMLHESPYGMGIAHDSGNAYWYFDGYYGELVYYDFNNDHDTGGEDHEDGVVRRHSDISLTRRANTPGHMILDKSTGILYISEPALNRVLWVNTDDATTTTTNIYNSPTRMETLAEYSDVTGMEWGELAGGLNRPSGIALDGDTLFVSQNGDGKITAYDLSTNGKSATEIVTVQTNANSIMGLEVGPDGKMYYVDSSLNKVIRLDTFPDADEDGVRDSLDNCLNIPNSEQENHDGDMDGDVCDDDDDGDGINDSPDMCALGVLGWISSTSTDHDGDGCRDADEDQDDDGDGVEDIPDDCPKGMLNWNSDSTTDYDSDGCNDTVEDFDDDSDGICDTGGPEGGCSAGWPGMDRCPLGRLGFLSSTFTDRDRDGCEDSQEDDDDDDDGHVDASDACPDIKGNATEGSYAGCPDFDGDGWADQEDEYPSEPTQWKDTDGDGYGDQSDGVMPDSCPETSGSSLHDRLGCPDADEDGYSDPDEDWTAAYGADAFPIDETQWKDQDLDSYGDEGTGFQPDACPDEAGNSNEDRFGCPDSDADGWSDVNDSFPQNPNQWSDWDEDGYGDESTAVDGDQCPFAWGNSTKDRLGCVDADGDGWSDEGDAFPDHSSIWSDGDLDKFADQNGTEMSDDCPVIWGNSSKDRRGCPDADGDGVSDENDFYPQDASRSLEEDGGDSTMLFTIMGIIMFGIIAVLGAFIVRSRRTSGPPLLGFTQPLLPMTPPAPDMLAPLPAPQQMIEPQAIQPEMVESGPQQPAQSIPPPIPFEGIPPGWTLEQWDHYGQSWLEQQGRI